MTRPAPIPTAVRSAVRDVLVRVTDAAHTAPAGHTLQAMLTSAADSVARHACRADRTVPPTLLVAWLHGEAACHIVTAAGWPTTGATDPDLITRLNRLDRLPYPTRLSVLRRALNRLDATLPTPGTTPPARTGQRHLRSVNPGRCDCACTSGQPGGGCGHAGCAGRR